MYLYEIFDGRDRGEGGGSGDEVEKWFVYFKFVFT